MSIAKEFRYDGKRVLVVGGATGIGAATAGAARELGAEVVVLDHVPVAFDVDHALVADLRDRASIDAALEEVGPIDALFPVAGVAEGPDLVRINFIGHRHVVDHLLASGRLPRGSAICFISSVAGIGWESALPQLRQFLATPDYEAADAWVAAHEAQGVNTYAFAKQAINAYVAIEASPLLERGVRLNAICPGPTDTPLARANADLWLTSAQDHRDQTGCGNHTPEEMAGAMMYLNSTAARAISGVTLLVDDGHLMSSPTGPFAPGKLLMDLIMGRVFLT